MPKVWTITFAIFWALSILAAMLFFSQKKQVSFDPEMSLFLASSSANFESNITDLFKNIAKENKKVVFHLFNKNCLCRYMSKSHIRKLDTLFSSNQFEIHQLDITQYPEIAFAVPSTPAIVMFDEEGKLGYLGPYSSGYFCNPNTSLIETIATSIIDNRHLGSTIISESKGCYCKT
jgi:thioredoxin-related protein